MVFVVAWGGDRAAGPGRVEPGGALLTDLAPLVEDQSRLVIDDVHELGSTEALQQLRLLVMPRPAGHQVTGLAGSEVTAAAVTSAGTATTSTVNAGRLMWVERFRDSASSILPPPGHLGWCRSRRRGS